MAKIIDLTKSVYELVSEYSEVADIMAQVGFSEIKKKVMLNSVGKLITIPKGAKMKNIPMEKIITAFKQHGFDVINGNEALQKQGNEVKSNAFSSDNDNRIDLLKSYLKRLGEGEDLESVRKDFVHHFSDVEASEIMKAEQDLMAEGTPIEEVQRLCDVHSALFHGATSEEHGCSAAHEIKEMTLKNEDDSRLNQLIHTKGHPLYILTKENDAILVCCNTLQTKLAMRKDVSTELSFLRGISIHYAKKGDLLYPLLKVKYDVSGPSNVMWSVDDDIRAELSYIAKQKNIDDTLSKRLVSVLTRIQEMVYKEQNILFPICTEHFTQEEWKKIYLDVKEYDDCLGVSKEIWLSGEINLDNRAAKVSNGLINLPGGHFTAEQLTAVLNTIPLEITFVDENDINCFFNEGEKVFKRPAMAIGREVFSCHPPKIEAMVRQIIDDFRTGKQDRIPIWMEKNGRIMLVTYMAVRDKENKYLGTMEIVQDMEDAKSYFQSK